MSLHPTTATPARRPKHFWLLLALSIMLAAEIAAICTWVIFSLPGLLSDPTHYPWASLGPLFLIAPLAGLPIWWLLVEKPGKGTTRRGMVAGMISSIATHPLLWTIFALFSLIPSPGTKTPSLSEEIGMVILNSLLGLIFVGWMTTGIGCVGGLLLLKFRNTLINNADTRQTG